MNKVKSCKKHRKIRYIVKIATLKTKQWDVNTYTGEGMQKPYFFTRDHQTNRTGKTRQISSIFHRFWSQTSIKKRGKTREGEKRRKNGARKRLFSPKLVLSPPFGVPGPPNGVFWDPQGGPLGRPWPSGLSLNSLLEP